jgi:glucose-1-phosphate thymidylyltransferase
VIKRGIILAGGAGTRLYPATRVASKQLQTVYDKPMIYYPLSTLMLLGIRELLVISTPTDLPRLQDLLGDGSLLGVSIQYAPQPRPEGIAQALLIGERFIEQQPTCLILGDNLFYGYLNGIRDLFARFDDGALIFGYPVRDPERYGVVQLDKSGQVLSLEEKPQQPKSHLAIPGLYAYGADVAQAARSLQPSTRGELEITDLNRAYMARGALRAVQLGRGFAWLDTGTPESLLDAANFVFAIEARQGLKIGCIEEAAIRMGFIHTEAHYYALTHAMPNSSYRRYVEGVWAEVHAASPP